MPAATGELSSLPARTRSLLNPTRRREPLLTALPPVVLLPVVLLPVVLLPVVLLPVTLLPVTLLAVTLLASALLTSLRGGFGRYGRTDKLGPRVRRAGNRTRA